MPLSEQDRLVREARSGSPDAARRLLEHCAPTLRRYLEGRTGPGIRRYLSVSDLEQEVFARFAGLLERLPADAGYSDLQGLLLQNAQWVVHNAARSGRRFDGESAAPEVVAAADGEKSTGEVTLADERAWLGGSLAALDPELVRVVRLRLEDCSFATIAERLNMSEATARRRFLEAAQMLRSARATPDGD